MKTYKVYPNHGVCEIKGEVEKANKKFFIFQTLLNQMTILVPKDKFQDLGIRDIMDNETLKEVSSILETDLSDVDNSTWNRRYREYLEMIKSGNPIELAKVVSHLNTLKNEQNLSFGERKMLDFASEMLFSEINLLKEIV